jgi:hypothetical protein
MYLLSQNNDIYQEKDFWIPISELNKKQQKKKILELRPDFNFKKLFYLDLNLLLKILDKYSNYNNEEIYELYNSIIDRDSFILKHFWNDNVNKIINQSIKNFDIKKEIKNILKLNQKSKKKKIDEIKKNYKKQIFWLVNIYKNAKDIINNNENIEIDDFLKEININNIYSKEQIQNLFYTIFRYFYSHKLTKKNYKKYEKNADLFLKENFWIKIKKEDIEFNIIQWNFIFILPENKFYEIYLKINWIEKINWTLWWFIINNFKKNHILSKRTIFINWKYNYKNNNTLIHELKHSENKLFFQDNIKDEILAFLSEKDKDYKYIIDILWIKNSFYKYSNNYNKDLDYIIKLAVEWDYIIKKYWSIWLEILTILEAKSWHHFLNNKNELKELKELKKIEKNKILEYNSLIEKIEKSNLKTKKNLEKLNLYTIGISIIFAIYIILTKS